MILGVSFIFFKSSPCGVATDVINISNIFRNYGFGSWKVPYTVDGVIPGVVKIRTESSGSAVLRI